uniref:Uncharacterized protein n=1 Tax=Heterorhabditis bacteriophora TaxID=37862 RepID=A0A1I7X515_HETBA
MVSSIIESSNMFFDKFSSRVLLHTFITLAATVMLVFTSTYDFFLTQNCLEEYFVIPHL